MQLYTSRRKKLGSAFSPTESELLLARIEQWLPRCSGSFSQAILLKGYFFSPFFAARHLPGAALLPPITLLRTAGLSGRKCPNRSSTPRGSTTTRSTPDPLPCRALLPLFPVWMLTLPRDINITHSFSASQMSCEAASKGRGNGTFELLPQCLSSGSQKQGRAFPQLQQQRLTQGCWKALRVDPATSPCPGGMAKLTSWSVEEQGLLSGFKRGNYFCARPSQPSSTRHTI